MEKDEIDRLRKACDEAACGPWKYVEGWGSYFEKPPHYVNCGYPETVDQAKFDKKENAIFSAEARIALPAALSEIESLNKKLEIAKEALAWHISNECQRLSVYPTNKETGEVLIRMPDLNSCPIKIALNKINGDEK